MNALRHFAHWSGSQIRRKPLFWAALIAGLGILAGECKPDPTIWLGLLAITALGSLGDRTGFSTALAIACGFASAHSYRINGQALFPPFPQLSEYPGPGILAEADGIVAGEPTTGQLQRFRFELRQLRFHERSFPCRQAILVTSTQPVLPRYGQRLRLIGDLHLPARARNPGEFDYRRYLWREGIPATLHVGNRGQMNLLSEFEGSPFKRAALRCRSWLRQVITRDLPNGHPACATLEAMTLGLQQDLPEDIENAFRHSGTLHLFSVSGLHVSIIGTCVWLLASPFGLPRRRLILLIIPAMFAYAYVTGWQAPSVRAAIMASVFLAALTIDRRAEAANCLGAAAFILLCLDSHEWFKPSFQLSFGIVLSMILLAGPLMRPFRRFTEHDPFLPDSLVSTRERLARSFAKRFAASLSVSLAASLGSLPLVIGHFGLVTPSGIAANLLLIPLSFPVLLTALLSIGSAILPFLQWVGVLFNNANFGQVSFLIYLANLFASLPGASQYVTLRPGFVRAPTEVTLLDLPEGGALHHVAHSDGTHALIDAGHSLDFRPITRPYLRTAGVSALESLWLTHADAAHIGGAPSILAEYAPRVLFQSNWEGRGPTMTSLRQAIDASSVQLARVHAGQNQSVKNRSNWQILYPPEDNRFRPSGADNQCLVLKLHAESWSILFVSDSGFITEQQLLRSSLDLKADVLVKGYHRDGTSGGTDFLQAVGPSLVITDLEESPHAHWIDWLHGQGIPLIDQRDTGALRLELRPGELRAVPYLKSQEFRLRKPLAKS